MTDAASRARQTPKRHRKAGHVLVNARRGQGRRRGKYLARAGYDNVLDAMRDLLEDVLDCAQDLRQRREIEPAVEMEKLAEEIASYMSPR